MFMCPKAHKERKRGKVKKSKRWGSEWTRGSGCPGPRGANSSHARKIAFPYLIHWTCARWTWHVRDIPRPDTIQLQQTSSHRSHVCLHFNDILEMRRLFSFRYTPRVTYAGLRLLSFWATFIHCLHYTTGWMFVYTIQLVDNRFDNRVERTTTVPSTGLNEQPLFVYGNRLSCRLYTRYSRLSGLTTGWMFVYTIRVVKPDWQQVVSRKRALQVTVRPILRDCCPVCL